MHILVPIKQVPETSAVRMDEETGTMVRDGVEAIVNPLDLYAVECALQIREQFFPEARISALTMGPPKAEKALREVLSMGIDQAVLVSDRAFAGADTWSTSYVIAAAIRQVGETDLVICGERATDGDTGQVGPGIAAFLDWPVVSYVSEVEDLTSQRCRLQRLVEDGHEVLEADLPAVLTVVKEVADPRLPTLRGKQRAKKEEIQVFGAADLEIEKECLGLKGSPTRVVKIFRPKVTRQCEKLTALDPEAIDEATERVIGFLRERNLLQENK